MVTEQSSSTAARWLAFLDLRGLTAADLRHDLLSSLTVTVLGIPQGVAYAMIAGLPPAMGLYASCVPTIIGSLFRSSRHVVSGPTNALSLLVGTAGAAAAGLDPIPTALLIAFLVGVVQTAAGVLRLGVLVDFVSIPVVVGYITGAGVLIGIGQLHHLTETPSGSGNLFMKVLGWAEHLHGVNGWALLVGLCTAAAIVALRKIDKRIPGAIVVLSLATLLSWLLDFHALGLSRVAEIAPIPVGLPPLTLPGRDWSFDAWATVMPVAIAATVLSLVESSAVARAIATRTGQRLELSTEFLGMGLSNLTAAFFGGYTGSGSLSRSALAHISGGRTRLGPALSGVFTLCALLFLGPAINFTPLAALAGLLLVVAVDLVDVGRIRRILKARPSDAAAFVITVAGTWLLRLDYAVYLGVLTSLVLYLRRARLLSVHEIVFSGDGHVVELRFEDPTARARACSAVRLINVEGQLFFAAAGELMSVLDEVVADESARVVILRIRRARGLDITAVDALEAAADRLEASGRELFIVGVRPDALSLLERSGARARVGSDHVIATNLTFFEAAETAMRAALESVGEHPCGDDCPLQRRLDRRASLAHDEGAQADPAGA